MGLRLFASRFNARLQLTDTFILPNRQSVVGLYFFCSTAQQGIPRYTLYLLTRLKPVFSRIGFTALILACSHEHIVECQQGKGELRSHLPVCVCVCVSSSGTPPVSLIWSRCCVVPILSGGVSCLVGKPGQT